MMEPSTFNNVAFCKEVPERYICQLCQQVMERPIQTVRGNSACEKCYSRKKGSTGKCPIDGELIRNESIFLDRAKEREIFCLQCYCKRRDAGCMWQGTLRDVPEHQKVCPFKEEVCPICKKSLPPKEHIQHFSECHKKNSNGVCMHAAVGCKFQISSEEEYSNHLVQDAVYHNCLSLKHTTKLKEEIVELQSNEAKYKQRIQSLETEMENMKIKTEEQQNHFDSVIASLMDEIEKLKKKLNSSNASANSNGSSSNMSHLNMVKENSDTIKDIDLKLQLHENTTYDGHLIWKINNLKQRTEDAKTKKIVALHSAPCFTSRYGYKFCLRLYLNGDGMGRGTHLSLFLVIMRSEYDNVLEWPFKKHVEFTLINQQNRRNDVVERMIPNEESSSFQQPRKEMNIASGCPLFIALDRLENEGFIKDDSLFLDVKLTL